MRILVACLSADYNGIERPINSMQYKVIKSKTENICINDRVCYYMDGVYYVYQDKYSEYLDIIFEYTALELSVENGKNRILQMYGFYEKIKNIIPCELIIGFWKPFKPDKWMNLEFVGIDLCEYGYESFLRGVDHEIFQNEEEAMNYLSSKSRKQLGDICWSPLYVYRVLSINHY